MHLRHYAIAPDLPHEPEESLAARCPMGHISSVRSDPELDDQSQDGKGGYREIRNDNLVLCALVRMLGERVFVIFFAG